MNDKTPNKHFFPPTRTFTFDDERDDWLDYSHNFYFFEGEDTKVYYFDAKDGKNFFYESDEG